MCQSIEWPIYSICNEPPFVPGYTGGGPSSKGKLGGSRSRTTVDSFNMSINDEAATTGDGSLHDMQDHLMGRSLRSRLSEGLSMLGLSGKRSASSHAGSSSGPLSEDGLARHQQRKRQMKHRR